MDREIIKASVDNSIRSMFQMVAVIDDASGRYEIVDHNRELKNIALEPETCVGAGSFRALCESLKINIHPEDREEFANFSNRDFYVKELSSHVHISMECRLRHSDSKYYWSEIVMCNSTAEDSTEGNDCIFLLRDINERKTKELAREAEDREILKRLQNQYDALFEENMTDQQTECYNRKGLKYYSDIIIDDARKNDRNLFVCVTDLNGLKHLNDTHGHAAGDEAIGAVAGELKKASPSGGKVVRIGGDEFLILASVDRGSTEPDDFASKLDNGLEKYNSSHANPYSVGASYGWVLKPVKEGTVSLDEYIEEADHKMYEMRVIRDKYRRD